MQVASSIAAADTQRGETWTVVVTPDDGKGLGESTEASITILNSPPLIAAVNITPAIAVEGDVLSCNYSGEFDIEWGKLKKGEKKNPDLVWKFIITLID